MFQEIQPHVLDNQYKKRKPVQNDYLVSYKDNKVLVYEDDELVFPTISEISQLYHIDIEQLTYLFDIDNQGFFLFPKELSENGELKYQDISVFRKKQPVWLSFGGATAMHLARWYENNRFCGKCSQPMDRKEDERALCCPNCGLINYPKINPVIIVGITNGDQLLLTKYAHSEYKRYSLVAGFMEIGETLEDTVKREIMEEVGLKVKNIRYYKSQPWAFSESLLAGFFADVDGDPAPVIDMNELSEAVWVSRDEMPVDDSSLFSLTWDMIECFRQGNI